METSPQKTADSFPATVVTVLDPFTVVINKGSLHAIREGQRFLIYTVGDEEIVDPDSGENLGRLEIVKGSGKAFHVQARMTQIRSDREQPAAPRRTIRKRSGFSIFGDVEEIETAPRELAPFDEARPGDKAKPI